MELWGRSWPCAGWVEMGSWAGVVHGCHLSRAANTAPRDVGRRECGRAPLQQEVISNKTKFSPGHKRDRMTYLVHKRYLHHSSAARFASSLFDGTKKTEFCPVHKRDNMMDLVNKSCLHHGCSKMQAYGLDGSKKKEFCVEHKRSGMLHVASKRCGHHCSKEPSYGVEDSKKRALCVEFKRGGMLLVAMKKRYLHHNGSRQPSYGVQCSKEKELCIEHVMYKFDQEQPAGVAAKSARGGETTA